MQSFNWAITDTYHWEKATSIGFYEFGSAKHYAKNWSEEVGSVFIWKLTQGNPIKWMEVN